jgi:uncharacterized membrane protein
MDIRPSGWLKKSAPLTEEHLEAGLKSRIEFEARWPDRVADFLTEAFGTTWFLIANFIFFVAWFVLNSGVFVTPFDPYPYNFLTMVVSLEAIFLAIIVLMSQNRASKVADIRQKMDFEINVRAENEITRVLLLIEKLHEHMGSKIRHDHELREMERHTDLDQIRREAQK